MNTKLFNRLVESMTQMNEIIDGECAPSRENIINNAIRLKKSENPLA